MSPGWIILVVLVGWVSLTVVFGFAFALLGNLARIADCMEVWVNLELAREEERSEPLVPNYPPEGFRDQ